MPSKLVEKRNELKAKQDKLAGIFRDAKTDDGDYDFTQVKDGLDGDQKGRVEAVQALNRELEALAQEVESLAEFERMEKGVNDLGTELKGDEGKAKRIRHDSGDEGQRRRKTLGERFVESKAFQAFKEAGFRGESESAQIEDFGLVEVKTLFETTAGWAPESTRIPGLVIEGRTRPIQVLDLIPPGQTDMASVVYMEETTRTHASAEKAEGVAYAESTFVLTEKTSSVRKITDSLPVTDEQLEDVSGIRSYIDNRLMFGLRQRLDNQVLNGNGTAPNLEGILNVTGIQTQAKGTDPVPDAIHKAMTLVQVTGRAQPNAVVMHHNDWEGLRLLRTSDGIYIWGSPSDATQPRVWGLPIALSDAITENTALVGDFANFVQLYERRGVDIQVGYSGTQFVEGKRTIRADLRVAFVTYRPTAFATVTSI